MRIHTFNILSYSGKHSPRRDVALIIIRAPSTSVNKKPCVRNTRFFVVWLVKPLLLLQLELLQLLLLVLLQELRRLP